MKKLDKLIHMGVNPKVESIMVYNKGGEDECYIDSRTKRSEKGIAVVKPIAENEKYIWYVCPFCQEIHIESKRCLNVNNKVLWTNCRYRNRVIQYILIDSNIEPIAQEEVLDSELEEEYNFMQGFERM